MSIEGLRWTLLIGKECKEGQAQTEFKQEVHWLENGEMFLDVCWSGDVSISENQAFTVLKLLPEGSCMRFSISYPPISFHFISF